MTIYQVFNPETGEEVYPVRWKELSPTSILDLDTGIELVQHKCEVLKEEIISYGECSLCGAI